MTEPESILEEVAEDFLSQLRAGSSPSIKSYVQRYPALGDDIFEMLSSIEMMERFSQKESYARERANAQQAALTLEKLGEFDIVREIGRGGMGVVYEAVDRTLQRRVALKVLNDSALTTQKHIDRFQRESRLAARLHHTNIVSVFGVGEEDRKHFYAMQYVDGISLGEVIEGLKARPRNTDAPDESDSVDSSPAGSLSVVDALRRGEFAESRNEHSNLRASSSFSISPPSAVATSSKSHSGFDQTIELSDELSNSTYQSSARRAFDLKIEEPDTPKSDPSTNLPANQHTFGSAYWRSIARIGIQVADALHYAHVEGVLHRDIKPANLLFDANGTVWVADFGLAKLAETDDLTKTGDVVGTLKYMAPEQLAGKADARTDVYALGMTLYELLSLRPVHDGETYKDLFAQKQSANFPALRKLDPNIPRDLETIVHKALELEPSKRYASSKEILEDLQRFLDDRPVLARRATIPERAWRWCRRNRTLATMGAMILGLLLSLPIILGLAYLRVAEEKKTTEQTMNVVLEGVDDLFLALSGGDAATASALTSSDDSASFAPAMLTKETAAMMEKMLAIYDRLAEQDVSASNVALATESAKARRRVGDLYRKLGRFEKATKAYADAAGRYSELSHSASEHQLEVARIHQAIGAIYEQREQSELAKTEYMAALDAIGMANSEDSQLELARTYYLLAKKTIVEGGPRVQPGGMADEWDELGSESERWEHLGKAIQLLATLRTTDPDRAETRYLLALCLRETEIGDPFGHEELLEVELPRESAAELLNQLVLEFPTVQRYRFSLCETYRSFSTSQGEGARLVELHLARELGEQLVDEQRDAAAYRINLAHIYAFLGIEYSVDGDAYQAEVFTRKGMEMHASVVSDFPGLAPLSARLSRNDILRLGRWLSALRRDEEMVELLQPLGEQIFEEVRSSPATAMQTTQLNECASLLLSSYESLEDDVGYFVALGWLDELNSQGGRMLAGLGPPEYEGPPGRGPAGPGPAGFGPPGSGLQNGPPGTGPPGRPGDFPLGPPPGSGEYDPMDMATSYDLDKDGFITREEVPTRMSKEWFERADSNSDGGVSIEELIDLLR